MPTPDRDAFARAYAAEFAAYADENTPVPLAERVKRHPRRSLGLASLVVASVLRVRGHATGLDWVSCLACVFAGIYLADLGTGLVHLLADSTPLKAVTGKDKPFWQWASYGFHVHHAHPQDWNKNDIFFAAILRAGMSFQVPVCALGFLFSFLEFDRTALTLLVSANAGLLVQISHMAAHGRFPNSSLIRTLQRMHFMLPPSEHRLHHATFDRNFAILTGWSNPVLNLFYRAVVRPRIDPGVAPEVQVKLYNDPAHRPLPPYLIIFPEMRANDS